MFTVFCDGHLLFDLKKHIVLTNPKLTIADNAAGALEFDIDPEHPMYDKIESMVSEIIVKQDGEEIWAGRATEQKTNFFGMKSVYCEGELAYLCDTIQEPSESHYTGNENVLQWLSDRLAAHNAKAPADKQFQIGAVTVVEPDELYRYTNYENTLECIKDKLIDRLGGHLRIRKVNGERFLDYLADYPGAAQQSIRFGLNLLEYSRTLTRADIATVCVPLGARLEEKDFPVLDKYLDVASVNDGSIYVENEQMVDSFGRIIKVVHWDDVATPENLLARARDWLNRVQFDDLRLEVNALDFHLADGMVPAIHLLDRVRVVSPPHGLDDWFPVTQLDIPLDNPAQMVFTLGKSERVSLTTRTNNALSSIDDDLETMPSAVLLQARKNATDLITSGALGGHVVVLPDELYITDSEDISAAQRMWRWNLNGLGYTKDGGKNYGTAITMDGKIVADYITAGQMSADRIFGGRIKLGGALYGNGDLYVYNSAGAEIGRWDKNGISVGAGTISGGTIKGASIQVGGNNDQEGTIAVHNSTGKEIGKWSKDGIDVTSGSIHGASVIVGGANNSNGSITVQNSSGTPIGTWDKDGISVKAGTISGGTISGAKITVGGKSNGAGTITVNGDDGKAAVTLDVGGITVKKGTISGATISGNTISGGTISGSTISGNTISGGKISGTSITVGGQNNKDGTITVMDSDGVTKNAVLSQSGLTLNKGTIKGTSITLGSKSNGDGQLVVKDENGTNVVKLSSDGVTVKKGTISIGSNFKVTAAGLLTAVNGTFKGTVTGSTITGSTVYGSSVHGGYFTGANFNNYEPEARLNLSNEKYDSRGNWYTGMRIYNSARSSYAIYFYPAKKSSDGDGTQWAPSVPRIMTKSVNLEILGHGNVNGTAGSKLTLGDNYFSLEGETTAWPSISSYGKDLEMRSNEAIHINTYKDNIKIEATQGNVQVVVSTSGKKFTYNGTEVAKVSSSSIRYKHGIQALSGDRNPHKLYELPVKEFEWNEDHLLQYEDMRGKTIPGIIAEDVEKIYPSAVIHDVSGRAESWDERRLIPGMLALIQEQHQRLCALERRLA